MIEAASRQQIVGMLLFCACMALLLLMRLLPLSSGFTGWPGADLALCLTFVWVLRRPAQIPALLIVAIFLFEDLILYRPPGLWTAFALMATEAARLREPRWRDQPFMLEWLRVGILMGMMMLGYRIVQILFLLPVPSLGQVLLQFIATLAAYPLVVFAARWLIGLRRISPAEAELLRYDR